MKKQTSTQLARKLDWHILPILWFLYFFAMLDRVNIGNARIMGDATTMEQDIGLVGNQFNWAVSVFFIGYVLFELPSNSLMIRFSAPVWISRIGVTWGIVASCTAAVQNFTGLMIIRFLLGFMEAGLVPGVGISFDSSEKPFEKGFISLKFICIINL